MSMPLIQPKAEIMMAMAINTGPTDGNTRLEHCSRDAIRRRMLNCLERKNSGICQICPDIETDNNKYT